MTLGGRCDEGGVDTIKPPKIMQTLFHSRRSVIRGTRGTAVAGALGAVMFALLLAAPAFAGQSATGVLAFEPCTQCHPVTLGADGNPAQPLPIGMAKHEVTLEVHDVLGEGSAACLACHMAPSANPGLLILPDGGLVDVTGDVSRVCQRCHFEKYREWQTGVHGKDAPKCSAAGCHDPHTPSWIYMEALPPFQGTGVEIRAVPDREPFQPLAGPPLAAAVYTPMWLTAASGLGGLLILALLGFVLFGKVKVKR